MSGVPVGIVGSSVAAQDALASAILALSPLGYWKLDETGGTTATDSSGNGRSGTYSGTYTLANRDGLVTLGGGNISLGDLDVWSVNQASGLSVFALVYVDAITTTRQTIAYKSDTGVVEWGFFVNPSTAASSQRATVWTNAGSVITSEDELATFPTAAWHAVAAAMPNSTASFDMWRDSSTPLSTTQTTADTGYTNNTAPMLIGDRGNGGATLIGSIGHVAVFAGVLTSTNIGTLMSAASADGWI